MNNPDTNGVIQFARSVKHRLIALERQILDMQGSGNPGNPDLSEDLATVKNMAEVARSTAETAKKTAATAATDADEAVRRAMVLSEEDKTAYKSSEGKTVPEMKKWLGEFADSAHIEGYNDASALIDSILSGANAASTADAAKSTAEAAKKSAATAAIDADEAVRRAMALSEEDKTAYKSSEDKTVPEMKKWLGEFADSAHIEGYNDASALIDSILSGANAASTADAAKSTAEAAKKSAATAATDADEAVRRAMVLSEEDKTAYKSSEGKTVPEMKKWLGEFADSAHIEGYNDASALIDSILSGANAASTADAAKSTAEAAKKSAATAATDADEAIRRAMDIASGDKLFVDKEFSEFDNTNIKPWLGRFASIAMRVGITPDNAITAIMKML